MAGLEDGERQEPAPNTLTELRGLEWELGDVIRRLEILKEQLRALHVAQASDKSEVTTEPGTL
jgi:hypothetical protein